MKRIIGIPLKKKNEKGERERPEPKPPKDPKPPPPNLSEIVAKADTKADELEKKIIQCENELRNISNRLRNLPPGPTKNGLKSKAQVILQRKKLLEQQSESFRQQSFNIEQTSLTIESTKDAVTAVKVLKKGVKELKKAQKKIHVDSVEDLHDELEQLFDQAQDVQDVLGSDLNMPIIDDDELEEQLRMLGEEFVADTDSSYLDVVNKSAILTKDPGSINIPRFNSFNAVSPIIENPNFNFQPLSPIAGTSSSMQPSFDPSSVNDAMFDSTK